MATLVTTDPGTTFTIFPDQTVEWSDDISDADSWELVPYLWCEELKLAVNAYSTAKLRYEIGSHVLQPGAVSIDDSQPLSLRGKYVRITVSPLTSDIVWVGYVLTDQVQRDGVKAEGGGPTNKFQGECQEFHVVGLEWWLDRKQVETSIVRADNADGFVRIQRALKFNGGESSTIDMKAAHRGNRTADTIDGRYAFSDDPTTNQKWSAGDIVDYLLHYHAPTGTGDINYPCLYFPNSDDLIIKGYLKGFHPTVTAEHQTVFALLNKIISPQRGLCWWLEFDSTADSPSADIRVASLARTAVALTGEDTLPANANQITLLPDNELDIKRIDVTNQGKRNYHRVICRGARQTVTFTVGCEDETLVADWSADPANDNDAQGDYEQAAVADSDYASLSDAKKKDRNDAMRKSDLLSRVFSYFRIPKDWDGKSGDGGTAEKHFAIAEISPTGSVLGGLPLTAQGIRLLNKTRLKLGVDYHDPANIRSNAPEGSLEEFVTPFVLLKVEKEPALRHDDGTYAQNPDRWQHGEHMGSKTCTFHAGTRVSTNIHTSYNSKMQPHVPGIIVNATDGMQHAMALGHYDSDLPEPSNAKVEVSYDNLRATVCAEADYYAEGRAEIATLPSGVPIEELIIDLGDDYRLDFLAKNTIVDLKNGIPVLAGEAGVLRDDRATLRDVARIAYEWYREDRQQLTIEFRQLRNMFSLGQLITTIGQTATQSTINTVISVITYSFKNNGTTTIETMDDTLDVRALRGGGIT